MKNIFFLFTLVSFNAFAINPHEGGGGNVCKTTFSGDRFVALDEAYIPLVNKKSALDLTLNYSPLSGTSFETISGIPQTSLVNTKAGDAVRELLMKLYGFDKEFGYELQNLFMTLHQVYVVDYSFSGAYGVDPDSQAICYNGTLKSVVLTNEFGRTVISKRMWNSLNFETQKIILLHETIRIAQMARPWLMKNPDLTIYRLTMKIYKGAFEELKEVPAFTALKAFKKKMRDSYSREAVIRMKKSIFTSDNSYVQTMMLSDYLEIETPNNYVLAAEVLKLKGKGRYIAELRDLQNLDSL